MSMNGAEKAISEIMGASAKVQVGNPAVIGLLTELLAQATRGEIVSIGLVMSAGPGRMTAAATPGCEFEIIAGCLDLQNAILAKLKRPAGGGLLLPR